MDQMTCVTLTAFGGPERLTLTSSPIPHPLPGHVRIRLEVAGVNFIDIYQRQGLYPVPLPYIPGLEGAGVIDALGPDVTEFAVGERVAYVLSPGSYAQYAVVPVNRVVSVPSGLDLERAAAVLLQGMTAHYLAEDTFPLRPGQVALVHAAAGGTGRLLVQLAREKGARVIALVSSQDKVALASAAGAQEVFLSSDADWVSKVRASTDGKGVHVVYDSVGRETFEKSLATLRPRGMCVLYGQSSGPVGPVDLQMLNQGGSLYVTRPSLGHYIAVPEELTWRASEVFERVTNGSLELRVETILPLSEAGAAQIALASRKTTGKLLLRCP